MALVLGFHQGFGIGAEGINAGNGYGAITRFTSGTNSIAAPDGDGYYAVLTESGSGPYTQFGIYSPEFIDKAQAEVKVYFDTQWQANDSFQYTVAANGSDGAHQRDFGFQIRAAGGGKIQIGASNGATQDRITGDIPNALVVEQSGWYTLQHVFNNVNGVLSVDMNLIPPVGPAIRVATLSDSQDTIGSGGTARSQLVVATPAWPDRRMASRASAGVFHPSVLRGLPLSAAATAARSSEL